MIAHVILFRPRAKLAERERAALVDALSHAVVHIPSLRRCRMGTRVTHGRGYEQLMRERYDYAAILEFDNLAALKAYLDHPAHTDLAQRFFSSCESVLIYDYELSETPEEFR